MYQLFPPGVILCIYSWYHLLKGVFYLFQGIQTVSCKMKALHWIILSSSKCNFIRNCSVLQVKFIQNELLKNITKVLWKSINYIVVHEKVRKQSQYVENRTHCLISQTQVPSTHNIYCVQQPKSETRQSSQTSLFCCSL